MSQNRTKTFAKNIMILGIGQFVPKLIALIILPVLTKYLSTNDYGLYDLILSLAGLALPILTLLVQLAAFRFLIDPSRDKRKTITNTFLVIGILISVWIVLLSILSLLKLYNSKILWMIFFLYVTESLYDSAGQIVRGLGSNFQYSISIIIFSSVDMVLLLLLLLFNFVAVFPVVLISALGYMIGFAHLCIKGKIFSFISISSYSKSYIKEILQYSLPIIPSSVMQWVVALSDRLLIVTFLGISVNGIYAAANKIPNLCNAACSVFNLAWTENASRTSNDVDRDQYYSVAFNFLFSFMVGVVMFVTIISPIVFNILIDSKFIDAIWQMPPLFLGVLFSCMVSFLGGIYVGLKQTKQVGVSSAVGAIINLGINFLLIRNIGLYAASISTLTSFFLIFVYRIIDLKKHIALKYDIKMFLFSLAGLFIITSLFYLNHKLLYFCGTLVCIVYNYCYNKSILLNMVRIVKH